MGTSESSLTAITFTVPADKCVGEWKEEINQLLNLLRDKLQSSGFICTAPKVSAFPCGSFKGSLSGRTFLLFLLWPLEGARRSGQIRIRYARPVLLRILGLRGIPASAFRQANEIRSAVGEVLETLEATDVEWTGEEDAELRLRTVRHF